MFLLPISGILDLEGDDDKLDLLNCSQLPLELLLVFLLNLSFFLVLLLWLWLSRKDFVHSKSRNRAPQITMFKKMPAKITDAPLHPLYSEMIEFLSYYLAGTFVNAYIKLGKRDYPKEVSTYLESNIELKEQTQMFRLQNHKQIFQ